MNTALHEPIRVKRVKKYKRIKLQGDIPLEDLEARIEEMAEEDQVMTMYERGVEAG